MGDTKFPFNIGDEVYIELNRCNVAHFEAVYKTNVTDKLIDYLSEDVVEKEYLEYTQCFYFKKNNLIGYIAYTNGILDLLGVAWGFCDVTIVNRVSRKSKVIEGNINPYKLIANNNLIPIKHDCDTICAHSNKFDVTIIRNPTYFYRGAVYHDFEKPVDREFYQTCFGDKIAKLSVDNNEI
jgi:hypothetical protein